MPLSKSQKNSPHFKLWKLGKLNIGWHSMIWLYLSDFPTSVFHLVMEGEKKKKTIQVNTSWLLEQSKPGVRRFSHRPAIRYPHGHWIINGEERTNNQEKVLGSHYLKFTVLHNIKHVQFTCQELSDSYSGVPFSYFDLIQHLSGWWSMSEDVDLLLIPLNFGIWLCYHASYGFIYKWSY